MESDPEFVQVLSTTDYFGETNYIPVEDGDNDNYRSRWDFEIDHYFSSNGEAKEFYAFVKQIDKSKSVIRSPLTETQLLFDSLMQEYFG